MPLSGSVLIESLSGSVNFPKGFLSVEGGTVNYERIMKKL
jgi:hypothetical protein